MSARLPLLVLSAALLIAQGVGLSAQHQSLISAGDAYSSVDPESETWTIGTSGIRLSLALDPREGLKVLEVASPYTGQWNLRGESGTPVTLEGSRLALGSRALAFEAADATLYRGGVRLDLSFVSANPRAKVTRTHAAYPHSPVVETWTTFEPLGERALRISNLDAYDLTIQPGIVRWMSGLAAPTEEGGPFTLRSRELGSGEALALGSSGSRAVRAGCRLVPEQSRRSLGLHDRTRHVGLRRRAAAARRARPPRLCAQQGREVRHLG